MGETSDISGVSADDIQDLDFGVVKNIKDLQREITKFPALMILKVWVWRVWKI